MKDRRPIINRGPENAFDIFLAHPNFYDLLQLITVGDLAEEVRKKINISSFASLLEIGCGTGFLSPLFSGYYTSYVGLDFDENALQIFRKKFKNKLVLCGDAVFLPFASNYFDVIFSSQLSHHLSDEKLTAFVHESARIVRERFILLDNVLPAANFLADLLYRCERGRYIRTTPALCSFIEKAFIIDKVETFINKHRIYRYSLIQARRKP